MPRPLFPSDGVADSRNRSGYEPPVGAHRSPPLTRTTERSPQRSLLRDKRDPDPSREAAAEFHLDLPVVRGREQGVKAASTPSPVRDSGLERGASSWDGTWARALSPTGRAPESRENDKDREIPKDTAPRFDRLPNTLSRERGAFAVGIGRMTKRRKRGLDQ